MRRLILIVLLVLVLGLIPSLVSAQETFVVEEVYVQFWPEYDKPEMLVIYNIQLADEVELPATFSIRIPAAAGEPHALWTSGVGEGNADYQREVDGDWAWITFEVPLDPNIILEYYDPGLVIDGQTRTFLYTWPADFQVNSFIAEVQQPFDASNMQLSEPAVVGTDGHGLTIHQMILGEITAGAQFELSVAYQKASDTLFKDMVSSVPSSGQDAADASTLPGWVPYLAFGGIFIIGVGIWMYWNSTHDTRPKRGRRRRPTYQRRSSRPSSPASSSKVALFCQECGTQAVKGDKFCRECGTKLRV